jgi:hypothetical protein
MTSDKVFQLCNLAALLGWIILVFAGRSKWAARLVTGFIIPGLLAAVYITLLVLHWGESTGGFGTLDAVMALFTNRWLVLAGWIHYLAFDLFIGSWQVRDSEQRGISHLLVIPCLGLTFFFGPAGLLSYLILRWTRGAAPHSLGGSTKAPY